ncbi:hypothetical protein ATCR1_14841 [Agrobacterium tumefaciens CCNWGS0286]|nr:hypothetical protein ATCR1_14841 [Agrobacterium tumefaciens CCNWGS0286]
MVDQGGKPVEVLNLAISRANDKAGKANWVLLACTVPDTELWASQLSETYEAESRFLTINSGTIDFTPARAFIRSIRCSTVLGDNSSRLPTARADSPSRSSWIIDRSMSSKRTSCTTAEMEWISPRITRQAYLNAAVEIQALNGLS